MEEQGTQGFNGQLQQNANMRFNSAQQERKVVIAFDGQQENVNMPDMFFNGQQQQHVNIQQHHNVNMSFQQHHNVNMSFNVQLQQNVSMPFNGEDNDNAFLCHEPLTLSYHSPPTLSPSHQDNNKPHAESSFCIQPLLQTYIQMPLQEQDVQMQIQQEQDVQMQIQQEQDVQMQIQQEQYLQMQIQQEQYLQMQIQQEQNLQMQIQQEQNLQIQIQQQHNLHMQVQQGSDSMALIANGSANSKPKETLKINGSTMPIQTNGEKKKRGRPRKSHKNECNGSSSGAMTLNSAKKFQSPMCDNGAPVDFQVIVIAPGEDVSQKVTDFWQQIHSAVVIIAANGTISSANLWEPLSGGFVNHKGEFEILSLSRSYEMHSDSLRVALFHPNVGIIRGAVAGLLVAASHVEVKVGVFSSDPIHVPGQVANKEPYVDELQAFGFQSLVSIAGSSKTETGCATDKSQGFHLRKITEPDHQELQNRQVGVQIEANGRRNNPEITGLEMKSLDDEFKSYEEDWIAGLG